MPDKRPQPKIIGLTGTNGSGKGEVAAYFQKNGYAYFSLSDLIREEVQKEGGKITRDSLIRKGNELRAKYGPDILARRVAKKIKKNAVVDSIRNAQEVEYFRRRKNFILLAVDAPPEVRFERVKRRGRDESATTFEEFLRKETEEMGETPSGQQLCRTMEMADFLIFNNGSLEELYQKLEKLL